MAKRIAVVGAGALGGYVGGTLAHLGHDVTLIDAWPENVETIRSRGLELDGMTPEERFTVKKAKILHVTEVQSLMKTPIDVAMVSMKSYDTAWATHLIAPYLSPQGFIVSLQNCMNEETIAGIVGWGRVVGVVASLISVDLYEAGRIRRTVHKGGDKYTIFRVGEPHGRITPPIDGAGHDQGTPHRDPADERPDRAQRSRDRRAGAEPCPAHRAGDQDRARRAQAFAFASGRLRSFAMGGS